MNREDSWELGKLYSATAAIGLAAILAAIYVAVGSLQEAKGFKSTRGDVLGVREVGSGIHPREELLVVFATDDGEMLMFAEAAGLLPPPVGAAVTVWYAPSGPPKALIVRQRFLAPALLGGAGIVFFLGGLLGRRLHQRRGDTLFDDSDLDFADE